MRSGFDFASVSHLVCLFLVAVLIFTSAVPFAVVVQATTVAERITNASNLRHPVNRWRSALAEKPDYRSGELLVRFRNTTSDQQRATTLAAHGLHSKKQLRGESGVERLEVRSGQNIETVASQLELDPSVEFVEPNYLIKQDLTGFRPVSAFQSTTIQTNDARFNEQWALRNSGQSGGRFGSDINLNATWELTTGSVSTVIAVIDSGIDFSHPDLMNNQWINASPGPDGDLHGWDFVSDSATVTDEQGHGTAVAGIIAAQGNNGIGTSGVMWRASLMSLRVLDDSGTGDIARAIEAIDYAVSHNAHIINISWGTTAKSRALELAIERAVRNDIVVVCSAGNGAQDLTSAPYYPASFGSRGLISVAATDNMDQLTSWSNWGRIVTIAAPGVDILTTTMNGEFGKVSGTSAAAPLVSGIVGLIRTARPSLRNLAIERALIDGARRVTVLEGKTASAGVASADGAWAAISGNPGWRGGIPQNSGTERRGEFDGNIPPRTQAPLENLPNLDETRNSKSHNPEIRKPEIEGMCPRGDRVCAGEVSIESNSVNDPDYSTARIRPANKTGENQVTLGSRNFNWQLPIVDLSGRGDFNLQLSVYYNSLVWTKQGTATRIGLNRGFPGYNGVARGPGFELHLPYLQQRYQNQDFGGWAYLLVTPSGARVELRQIGTSNLYESLDGNYTQLTDNGTSGAVMRTSDGTVYTFGFNEMGTNQFGQPVVKGRKCTEIKDRNGNFITATYNASGAITSITDTLGRVLNFNYNTSTNTLSSITQTRNGSTYTFATFTFGTVAFNVNFLPDDTANNNNGGSIQVLTQINLPDGTYHRFDYNGYAQVYRITKYAADGHTLNYTSYNLPLDTSVQQSDCPRFTERRDWAENWNNGVEVVTTYAVAGDGSWSQQTDPDGTIYKEFFATTGWQKGMTTATETWSGGVKQRWATVSWTQDDTSLTYPKNPRIIETNVYDAQGNRKRETINYGPYVSYNLPYEVIEYANNGSTMLRRTYTDYNLSSAYLTRRIIGLVSAIHVVDHATGAYVSKTSFDYDYGGEFLVATPAAATQHDTTNFGAGFITGRGNLAVVWRWDVTDIANSAKAIPEKRVGYNTTGSTVFIRTALGNQTTFSYNDSFADGINRNTFAYPTTITDPDSFSSTIQYNYDFGGVTRQQDPKGAVETLTYDSIGRMDRITTAFNGAYTRWVYAATGQISRFDTIQSGAGEAYSTTIFDGAGRVRATGGDLPGSSGGYQGQFTIYDTMGRPSQQSNPGEMNGSWAPTGDDAAGWVWTYQTYDWNARPLLTTNPDGSTRQNVYTGCGCAGGEVTTIRDERGRRRKLTIDLFGRLSRVDELNWDQSIYATTTYAYNLRNQATSSNQAGQIRSLSYDGYGRLQSRTTPEQGTTTYSYFGDGTVQSLTDARGASTTYGYNNRRLVTSLTYGVPGGVAATANVSFSYDSAGNRTSMTDGLGSVSYSYDTLSRLTSESRTITGVGTFGLTYTYNLAGQLATITNAWGSQVVYGHDKMGRVTGLTGSGSVSVPSYISGISYRAFGAAKQMSYGNGRVLTLQYNTRLRLTRWDLPKPGGGSTSTTALGYTYSYNQYGEANTGRPDFANSLYDGTLDRSWSYDHVGRLVSAYSGSDANGIPGSNGPYAQIYGYDVWGNRTHREGWGGIYGAYTNDNPTFTNNRQVGLTYDAAGNYTAGGTATYDATGQQIASSASLSNAYDGDGLRIKKTESGVVTYYLRSSAISGQVIAELNSSGNWTRGYVYLGTQLVAVQNSGQVTWVHQEPFSKGQRFTDTGGNMTATVIEVDPFGGETSRTVNGIFQPQKYSGYTRDADNGDDAKFRRYNASLSRFSQPDPFDGSYHSTDPQSFNRYSYVQNDPVNLIDPSGLDAELDQGVGAARTALQGALCRSLFGNIDPTNLLNTYYNNGLITSGSSYPVAQAGGGNRTERFASADTGAVTSYAAGSYLNANGVRVSANPITVNSNGFYYTGRLANNRPVGSVRGGGFEGLNMSQIRGAVIIHELLHAANKIPADNPATLNDDGRQSKANSERVRVFCFSRLNNPNAPIPVPNNIVPNTTITLRRTERVIGRVPPTVRVGGIGPLSWLDWLYGANTRGRGELSYAGPFR